MAKNEKVIRSASATDVEPPVTGSPIIIGGGGGIVPAVAVRFRAGEYDEVQRSSRTRFVHKGALAMQSLILTINEVPLDLSDLLDTEDVEIHVRCPGSDNDLNFFLSPQAVEFDKNTYKKSPPPTPSDPDVFQSADSFASRIKIRLQGVEIRRELSRADKFSLKADII